jgi:hypothetical protein
VPNRFSPLRRRPAGKASSCAPLQSAATPSPDDSCQSPRRGSLKPNLLIQCVVRGLRERVRLQYRRLTRLTRQPFEERGNKRLASAVVLSSLRITAELLRRHLSRHRRILRSTRSSSQIARVRRPPPSYIRSVHKPSRVYARPRLASRYTNGAKALTSAVRKMFSPLAEIQRCQTHKHRNIVGHLRTGSSSLKREDGSSRSMESGRHDRGQTPARTSVLFPRSRPFRSGGGGSKGTG